MGYFSEKLAESGLERLVLSDTEEYCLERLRKQYAERADVQVAEVSLPGRVETDEPVDSVVATNFLEDIEDDVAALRASLGGSRPAAAGRGIPADDWSTCRSTSWCRSPGGSRGDFLSHSGSHCRVSMKRVCNTRGPVSRRSRRSDGRCPRRLEKVSVDPCIRSLRHYSTLTASTIKLDRCMVR